MKGGSLPFRKPYLEIFARLKKIKKTKGGYMKTTNNKKSKFLALLLSVMIFSSMGAAFAACADDADSSSSSSSSSTEDTTNDKVDNGTIKNSNFDFTNLTDTVKIGTSVTGNGDTLIIFVVHAVFVRAGGAGLGTGAVGCGGSGHGHRGQQHNRQSKRKESGKVFPHVCSSPL